jgi:chorismate synthase
MRWYSRVDGGTISDAFVWPGSWHEGSSGLDVDEQRYSTIALFIENQETLNRQSTNDQMNEQLQPTHCELAIGVRKHE